MKRIAGALVLCLLFNCGAIAQELNCKVTINTSQLASQGVSVDKSVFFEIEKAIFSFMNNQRWTSDIFSEKEKIKCNLVVNLMRSPAQNKFIGNAQFQVIRPVFGSTYETAVLQFFDRAFDFSFAPEDRQMIFNEQTFNNNLTSILAFYSLLALAADYDSFSKLGGTPYVERAFLVANLAASALGGAWAQNADVRDRYWLVENMRSQQFNGFREGNYEYHRLSLDDFASNPSNARKQVLDYLKTIKNTAAMKPNSVLINSFFDAKSLEILNIFSEASKQEKQQVFGLLSSLDPEKTENYRKLLK
jgi:Domain of unknown function (DUF4835)